MQNNLYTMERLFMAMFLHFLPVPPGMPAFIFMPAHLSLMAFIFLAQLPVMPALSLFPLPVVAMVFFHP